MHSLLTGASLLKIFIGYDKNEIVAYHVLAQSIIERSSIPVAIIPLNRDNLKHIYKRPKGDLDSTDFSISRFLVPYLCNYEGFAVFMDCDMLCVGDVAELASYMSMQARWSQSVFVVKHKYTVNEETKFLGAIQTQYEKKNWSSVMIFNNAMCRALTPEYVNKAPGLELHQFKWTNEDLIGRLPKGWNYLVGEENQEKEHLRLIHYTKGTPCFDEYMHCEWSDLWHKEKQTLLSHG